MKYKNAQDILPDQLLRELQQYISGGIIYVPTADEKKSWGENSGARDYYKERNKEIRAAFQSGNTQEQIAEKYNLSMESVNKILYNNNCN